MSSAEAARGEPETLVAAGRLGSGAARNLFSAALSDGEGRRDEGGACVCAEALCGGSCECAMERLSLSEVEREMDG